MDFLFFTWEAGVYCLSVYMIFSFGLCFFSFHKLSTTALIPFSSFPTGFPVPPLSLNVFFFSTSASTTQSGPYFQLKFTGETDIFLANSCLGRVFMYQITSWSSAHPRAGRSGLWGGCHMIQTMVTLISRMI